MSYKSRIAPTLLFLTATILLSVTGCSGKGHKNDAGDDPSLRGEGGLGDDGGTAGEDGGAPYDDDLDGSIAADGGNGGLTGADGGRPSLRDGGPFACTPTSCGALKATC